ncbi:protein kinase domain-containing protein [Metabacillus arenae]|uniref:Serine/threonine protein kinase n=1 Tax=Metabacillus arenae TaxID=2771434 RepID=A0A926NLC5_9BACI|nr:serine/threonine-protein kinase [Metabacillus arenae]MBD1383185.1 serine/threonine protein kinase [Metabacillus arenae]
MMSNTSMNQACKVAVGTIIKGKWHRNSYKILKILGYGANGVVYLTEGNTGLAALKLSDNSMSVTSEVNVLKHFSKAQGSSIGPSLIDVDDWNRTGNEKMLSFYAMEYIKGDLLLDFFRKKGPEWVPVMIMQLLKNLSSLHASGWVFGDLKPENLIVSGPPPKIRCIDVGGTTQTGRAIKEFTEFFDRGYWGLGTRKAEPSYDLFAVAMIVINAAYPKRFVKKEDGKNQLWEAIDQDPFLKKYEKVLKSALLGKYESADTMKKDFIITNEPSRQRKSTPVRRASPVGNMAGKTRVSIKKKKKKSSGFVETLAILASVFILYSLYVYYYLL